MSLILSRRDIDFVLYEWLRVEELCRRAHYAHHDRHTFDGVLDICQKMATDLFAPHYKKSDREEPRFDGEKVHLIADVKKAIDALRAAGLMGAGQALTYGGMQLPNVIERAAFAWFNAANASTAAYPLLSMAAANLLVEHGTREQIDRYALPILDGHFFGTMCLSEPQAGSSLSDIVTRAEPQADGSYRLFGTKMWISAGEHDLADNIVHLVLAKIPGGPPGAKGISLFIVPKRILDQKGNPAGRNDVALAGINHKMGNRGTVNTILSFGEGKYPVDGKAGALGFLVGEVHNGLACMFFMMNEARIGVGTAAAALGYTGYLHALEYARNRPQGRLPGSKNAQQPQVPLVRHADIKRMLLAQKAYAEGGLAFNLYCARLIDEARSAPDGKEDTELLLDLLTPIAKSWPSQWCVTANDLAIQVHGGYGYTREFNVEQFYRDNRLNPIHEGTHGIQAIDLLGRKTRMKGGRALGLFADRVSVTCAAAAAEPALRRFADAVQTTLQRLVALPAKLHSGRTDEEALANATVYLEAFGHLAISWIWLDVWLTTLGKEDGFYRGKRAAAQYFLDWELPRVAPMLDLLERNDRLTLDLDTDWL